MNMRDIASLLKFSEDKSSCLIHEPPAEWIDLVISAATNQIFECPKITIATKNANIAARCKEELSKAVTMQWQQKAQKTLTPSKPRKRKATSVPPSPVTPSQRLPEIPE
uniref:Uncharacterized protein n=1 Tax=Panagrolaimus superbus TaxID=310955 RepID=A0A914YTB2_9BILA